MLGCSKFQQHVRVTDLSNEELIVSLQRLTQIILGVQIMNLGQIYIKHFDVDSSHSVVIYRYKLEQKGHGCWHICGCLVNYFVC